MAELNNHAAHLDAERTHFMSKETYEARHSELQAMLEARSRELAHDNKILLETLDRKLAEHERSDNSDHDIHENRLNASEAWINNQKGRQWAIGVGVSLLAGLVSMAVQVLYHIFSK